ncbi:hypothetical protein NDU88_010009 [Pleurodeles waltl]|uniref:Uncharacterized protein n=1 Tax=Pleurodeles waltl TaxID=8319 RepID=A0AAV7S1C6_PLEWA|nr:hypothetical protein NDU88_010009 [Pleurodeles waltl]
MPNSDRPPHPTGRVGKEGSPNSCRQEQKPSDTGMPSVSKPSPRPDGTGQQAMTTPQAAARAWEAGKHGNCIVDAFSKITETEQRNCQAALTYPRAGSPEALACAGTTAARGGSQARHFLPASATRLSAAQLAERGNTKPQPGLEANQQPPREIMPPRRLKPQKRSSTQQEDLGPHQEATRDQPMDRKTRGCPAAHESPTAVRPQ